MKRRVLLMYISESSGHHSASIAIENAFHELSDDIETLSVNSFHYTNPILEKIINRTYMSVIRRRPEFWGYLYDNPRIVKKTQKLKDAIHKYNSQKIGGLLEKFKPEAVICTQAFPCGIMADYKKNHRSGELLAGVLTDYAPHSYWLYDTVDLYFVPSEETKERLISNGIARHKIRLTGIPINPKFQKVVDRKKITESLNLSPGAPIILVMGGSQGVGPIKEVVKILNNSTANFQIITVTGGNKKLYRYLKNRSSRFNKRSLVLGQVENMHELMGISSLIISKPGGITISEAFTKGLPVLMLKPIPGHEQMNADHLAKHKVAIKIDNLRDIDIFVKELLTNPSALKNMAERAKTFATPNSAFDIARTILERIM